MLLAVSEAVEDMVKIIQQDSKDAKTAIQVEKESIIQSRDQLKR